MRGLVAAIRRVEVGLLVFRVASLKGGVLRGTGRGRSNGVEVFEDLGPPGRERFNKRSRGPCDVSDTVVDWAELDPKSWVASS